MRRRMIAPTTALLAAALVLPGCWPAKDSARSASVQRARQIGDPEAGATLIRSTGCAGCHIVPGVDEARGLVGPPLDHMARRRFIAGMLHNTPDNMVLWLTRPQQVVPGNAMPDVGLSQAQAQDVTAYLYTLD